jgi:hypothetical protein
MKTLIDEHLDVSTVERTSSELVKMVRKLRWIGMEDEAKQLETALSSFPADERETVSAGPHSTD